MRFEQKQGHDIAIFKSLSKFCTCFTTPGKQHLHYHGSNPCVAWLSEFDHIHLAAQ